ncbi:MAG: serine hydrolase, partial [Planctomycetes bacterium]|nr:serine hydrolase [Planctomycetota bacterium]
MTDKDYFPASEKDGGWRRLTRPADIVSQTGTIPQKLEELSQWSLGTLPGTHNAGLVIRHGWLVHEWGNEATTPTTLVEIKSSAKAFAILCTGLAIDQARTGSVWPGASHLPPLDYDSPAYDYIPEGHPLSDPGKAQITVRHLMYHLGGILPESSGVSNYPPKEAGFWGFVLGMSPEFPTARLYADPGTTFLYGSYGIRHLCLIVPTVTGMELDDFMDYHIFTPCGITQWRMDRHGGDGRIGPHADLRLYTTPRDYARLGYLMLRGGRWGGREILPPWLMEETFTHHFPGIVPDEVSYHWRRKHPTWPAYVPDDMYLTYGAGANFCIVVPSLDLVAVRMGTAFGADRDKVTGDFVTRLIAA